MTDSWSVYETVIPIPSPWLGTRNVAASIVIEGASGGTDPGFVSGVEIEELTVADMAWGGSAWDGGHLRMGNYHLWIDNTGGLRIKSSAPASDTDGTVVGTQS